MKVPEAVSRSTRKDSAKVSGQDIAACRLRLRAVRKKKEKKRCDWWQSWVKIGINEGENLWKPKGHTCLFGPLQGTAEYCPFFIMSADNKCNCASSWTCPSWLSVIWFSYLCKWSITDRGGYGLVKWSNFPASAATNWIWFQTREGDPCQWLSLSEVVFFV